MISRSKNRFFGLSLTVVALLPMGCVSAQTKPAQVAAQSGPQWTWEAVAPGGGGRFLGIGISPHNPNLLLNISDMGGIYRSEDAGASWETLPFTTLRAMNFDISQPQNVWCFNPEDAKLIFGGSRFGFYYSSDTGEHWKAISGPWNDESWKYQKGPRVITFDVREPDKGLAAFNSVSNTSADGILICSTTDRGRVWKPLAPLPVSGGKIIDLVFDDVTKGVLAATTQGVFRSEDGGQSWKSVINGLEQAKDTAPVYSFSAAIGASKSALYLTQRAGENGFKGGIYRSVDGAKSWQPVSHTGLFWDARSPERLGLLATSNANSEVVYLAISGAGSDDPTAAGNATVYRSDNGGESWEPTLFQHPQMPRYNMENTSWLTGKWGWTRAASGMTVSQTDSKRIAVTTITSTFLSVNAGQTWRQIHAPSSQGERQPAGGMQVMSVWDYYFDPHHPQHHFAAMTDFSGWQSDDGAKTWQLRTDGNPWNSNTYALAMDPAVPDRVWAACSVAHDIPTWKYLPDLGKYVGGVVVSTDNGRTWVPVSAESGLPRRAVTDIWLDPNSPTELRHLWAALPGHGVYFSPDGGKSWSARNNGISSANMNVLRVRGDGQGKLYALTTMKQPGTKAGALYISKDEGVSWQLLFSKPESPLLATFTLDPRRPDTVYVAALQTDPYKNAGGALWQVSTTGAEPRKIFDGACFSVTVDPLDSNRLYASSWVGQGDGVHVSTDGGLTWSRLQNYPFWRPIKVVFDPKEPTTMYVTNFGGGVFRGRQQSTTEARGTEITRVN